MFLTPGMEDGGLVRTGKNCDLYSVNCLVLFGREETVLLERRK